jgi:hypothetical protein
MSIEGVGGQDFTQKPIESSKQKQINLPQIKQSDIPKQKKLSQLPDKTLRSRKTGDEAVNLTLSTSQEGVNRQDLLNGLKGNSVANPDQVNKNLAVISALLERPQA